MSGRDNYNGAGNDAGKERGEAESVALAEERSGRGKLWLPEAVKCYQTQQCISFIYRIRYSLTRGGKESCDLDSY